MKTLLGLSAGNIRERPGRALLLAFLVACGVGMMVALQGVVTSIEDQFAPALAGLEAGADWVVYPNKMVGTIDGTVVEKVRALPEVAWTVPRNEIPITAELGGEIHKAVLWAIDPEAESKAGLFQVVAGSLPSGDSPGVALEANLARKSGLSVGSQVTFYLGDGQRLQWPVVALVKRGGVVSASVALVVHRGQAAAVGLPSGPQKVLVGLRNESNSWNFARGRLLQEYGAYAQAPYHPPTERGGGLSLVLLFSLIGPVIGVFLIQNGLTISFRQRRQELALWRLIGATRRQLVTILLWEGALVGLAGGVAGILLGVAVVPLVLRKLAGFASVPSWQAIDASALGYSPLLLLTSLAVGVGVTVLASLRPALAVSRLNPLEARRESYAPDPPVSQPLFWAGLATALLGLAASYALFGQPAAVVLAMLHFAGLVVILPALLQWGSSLFPVLHSALGAAMTIGVRRMAETRRRAASGATTLMLATALLLGFRAITDAAWQATAKSITAVQADLTVRGVATTPEVCSSIMQVPGVAGLTVLYQLEVGIRREFGEDLRTVWAIDPNEGFPFVLASGDSATALEQMKQGGTVLIGSRLARSAGWKIGDTIELTNPTVRPEFGRPRTSYPFVVAGVVQQDWDAEPTLWLGLADAAARFAKPVPTHGLVRLRPGERAEPAKARIVGALPSATVETLAERLAAARRGHGEKLGSFLALLYLVTGFAALGVIQTSLLVVLEQRRELTLMRAAGASPRQIAVLVLAQVALPGIIGGLLGAVSGLLFGSQLVGVFSQSVGADLHATQAGWPLPVGFAVLLAIVAALPATLEAGRQPVAELVRQE